MSGRYKFFCVRGFAEELDQLIYEGVSFHDFHVAFNGEVIRRTEAFILYFQLSNWLISFRSLFTIYAAHFSYLVIFLSTIICGLLSYRHSVENGKKFTHFWIGALVHGLISERGLTSHKYWHAQAPIMFFGKQLPLHILLFYPSVIYISMIAVHRLKLNVCTEPAAVGLMAMLMEIPFRMISVKFIHITYHDSDPMYYHKLCGVPWVEIFSSLVFAMSYVAVYHGVKYFHFRDVNDIWDNASVYSKEYLLTLLIGLSSPIAGFLQKVLIFHFLNDFFNVNPISCFFFVASVYLSFVVCFEPRKLQHAVEAYAGTTFLLYQITIYLSSLTYLALLGRPQNEISIGRHEPVGDCTMLVFSRTPLGKPMKRKKYLCADEVAARKFFVYNFDCLEEGPPCFHAIWYTICGSPIYNKPQFFLNVMTFIILLSTFFYKTMYVDTNYLDASKRMIVRFGSQIRRMTNVGRREETTPTSEEVTVGFVFIKNGIPHIPFKNLTNLLAKFSKNK